MTTAETLPKQSRLTGEIAIESLFKQGKSFLVFPLRVVYCEAKEENAALRALFSVPKKQHKHAVDRNRHKRLMRDVYRRHRRPLEAIVEVQGKSLHVAFILIDNRQYSYQKIETALTTALKRITSALEQSGESSILA